MKSPYAERRLFQIKVCMKCNSRNPWRARRCRNCGYTGLRKKSKVKKA